MHLLRPGLILASLVSLVHGLTGCVYCNASGCAGGFEWTARGEGDVPLAPGDYAVTIELETSTYVLTCTVAGSISASHCTSPSMVDGEVDFYVSFGLSTFSDDWDPSAAVAGFHLSASDTSDSDSDGQSSTIRGPEVVEIVVSSAEGPLVDVMYEVSYTRDDDYWGDERCGYCDLAEARSAVWSA